MWGTAGCYIWSVFLPSAVISVFVFSCCFRCLCSSFSSYPSRHRRICRIYTWPYPGQQKLSIYEYTDTMYLPHTYSKTCFVLLLTQ
ncbi:hypothetical protein F5J12DRAFT_851485 [Pisolithus orientalis]|uniref:uncharacterized protein n=1 Tax=Pisolithus orientalis TaxID=936130 RepID=UPI0022248C1C|nr:uncharacterized protein F5J12DRAFT_851485 [Pisolithus orientalis]KAI5997216.1 hypothetical protein F5J12DRAFT_851485 [Pisolithus orientalis]